MFSSDPGWFLSRGHERKPSKSLDAQRYACDLLLESLPSVLSPDKVSSKAQKDALKIAATWKSKMSADASRISPVKAHTFLQLLASYGISKEFNDDDLCTLVLHISSNPEAPELCRALQISHKIPEVVEKLSSGGKRIDAIRFVYAFGLVEKFPPVLFLKAYLKKPSSLRLKCLDLVVVLVLVFFLVLVHFSLNLLLPVPFPFPVLLHCSINLTLRGPLPFPILLTYIVLLQWPVSHLTVYLVRVYMTEEAKASINQPMMLEATHHLCQILIYIHQIIYNRLCMELALFVDQPIMEAIILAVVCLRQLLTSLHIPIRFALFGIVEAMH